MTERIHDAQGRTCSDIDALVMDLEAEVQRWRKLFEDESLAKSTAVQKVTELEARIALAAELADNCSGTYMRAILSGEIDRAEHERRRL